MKNIIFPNNNQNIYSESLNNDSEFPIHIFPKQIHDIIKSTNECSDYPIDYIAASLFCSCAVAIGNTHCVEVKKNWEETPIFIWQLSAIPE